MNQVVFVSNKTTPHKIQYIHHTHPSLIFRLKYPQKCGLFQNNDNDDIDNDNEIKNLLTNRLKKVR
jgi:hypothetical protein